MVRAKVAEKTRAHFLFSVTFPENRGPFEIIWKNIVQPGKPQIKI
jgi:hypothetical protein